MSLCSLLQAGVESPQYLIQAEIFRAISSLLPYRHSVVPAKPEKEQAALQGELCVFNLKNILK